MRRSRLRCLFAVVLTACGTLLWAPQAGADPRDWVPWCTGGQTPANSHCRVDTDQQVTGNAPGANPDVPLGVDPGQQPATGVS